MLQAAFLSPSFLTPHMRSDIEPLCDRHKSKMKLGEVLCVVGARQVVMPLYVCQSVGCLRRYNLLHGYFNDAAGGLFSPNPTVRMPCIHDSLPLFIAEYKEGGSDVLWKCAQE